MKKLITIIALAATCFAGYSQTTNSAEIPIIESPVWDFLTQGSNWMVAPYAIYDTTAHDFGAGIGVGYKLSEFVVPTLRLDYIGGKVWMPSGSIQLQAPVKLFGKLEVIPFAFAGLATPIAGKGSKDGNVVSIAGVGGAIRLPKSDRWYVPADILADYEKWNGAGFSDDQIRFGIAWKF